MSSFLNRIVLIPILFFSVCMADCGSKEQIKAEQNLSFELVPDPNPGIASTSSTDYTFKISITSELPAGGVVIDLTTVRDLDNVTVESKSFVSSIASISLTAGSINPGMLYRTTVTVSSKTNTANKASKSFKLARK